MGEGGRTAAQGFGAGDGLRQQFAGKERDSETGLDFSEARYYAPSQGRFTSTDPIIITENRMIDPQQINLYHYARNNPLRFTDPTGEDIDDSSLDGNDGYQKWKAAFLSTKSGRALWDKYNDDHSVNITITMGSVSDPDNTEGAETTPTFDANGKLTGATIILTLDFAEGAPTGSKYPILGSMTPTAERGVNISREARAVGILAHEFGHIEDAQRIGGVIWQQQNELVGQAKKGFAKQGQAYFNTREYQQIVSRLGDTPVSIEMQRDIRAERATIPVLREYFAKGTGHGNMPKRVRQAIQNYEKSHPR